MAPQDMVRAVCVLHMLVMPGLLFAWLKMSMWA